MKCLLTNCLICFALVMLLASCGGLVSESPAVPAPPEVLDALILKHEATIKCTQADFPRALKGGPGFTRETAWEVLLQDRFAVSIQYLVLGRLGLDGHQLKALVEENGRFYDMHLVEVEHAGKRYQVKQWFDITLYFKSH